jgi:hypothetical protein
LYANVFKDGKNAEYYVCENSKKKPGPIAPEGGKRRSAFLSALR